MRKTTRCGPGEKWKFSLVVVHAMQPNRSRDSMMSPRGVLCDDRDLLEGHRIQCSMSGAGSAYDNAAMESFFGLLKPECVYRRPLYRTRQEARTALFDLIMAMGQPASKMGSSNWCKGNSDWRVKIKDDRVTETVYLIRRQVNGPTNTHGYNLSRFCRHQLARASVASCVFGSCRSQLR